MTRDARCEAFRGGWTWCCADCGALLATTYAAGCDTMLDLRYPVRNRAAEQDGVPAYGRSRRRPEQVYRPGLPEAAAWRTAGKGGRLTAEDQQRADHNRWMPDLFDTWCTGCGRRNRVDVARRTAASTA